MATLKRKTSGGWETVAPPYPTQIAKHVTEIAPNFTTLNATANGEYTPQAPYNGFTAATINVTSGGVPGVIMPGDTPVLLCHDAFKATNTSSMQETTLTLTMPRAGTYRFKWSVGEGNGSSQQTRTQLYKNGEPAGTEHSTQSAEEITEELTVDVQDEITVWLRGNSYYGTWGACCDLCACIDWDNGFMEG